MSDHQDELKRVFAGLEQFSDINLIAAGSDTANSFNAYLDRLDTLGYDIEEFRITEDDYKLIGWRDRHGVMKNPSPTLNYGVLKRKHGSVMSYFQLRDAPVFVETILPKKNTV